MPSTLLHAEPGYSNNFVANSSGIQFYINTTYGSFMEAQENCNFNGGHLATYTNMSEQVGACSIAGGLL